MPFEGFRSLLKAQNRRELGKYASNRRVFRVQKTPDVAFTCCKRATNSCRNSVSAHENGFACCAVLAACRENTVNSQKHLSMPPARDVKQTASPVNTHQMSFLTQFERHASDPTDGTKTPHIRTNLAPQSSASGHQRGRPNTPQTPQIRIEIAIVTLKKEVEAQTP